MNDAMILSAPGYLEPAERLFIRDTALKVASQFGDDCTIVNIGVALGASCVCLRAGAPAADIVAIDVDQDSAHGDWKLVHDDSRRVHEYIRPPIHMLFVDGDHDYYGVQADILNWCPKIPPGGIVLFHDYGNGEIAPHTAGVKRAVDEWMDTSEWETIGIADSIIAFKKREIED